MSMNPIETTKTIKDDYIAYLQTILTVKDATLTQKAYTALQTNEFVKGPFLEATLPFVAGKTIEELISEGIASNEFKFMANEAHIERPLYSHQEAAFRKLAKERKNVIVATGTGSGKTECFLYPIFNELMREKENNTLTPGVRALLLYPMNALANDQIKRLRELLTQYPDITFGRYTGETKEAQKAALEKFKEDRRREYQRQGISYKDSDLNPLPNEIISRQVMRESPPHILLTNYAMLEYLLLRPEDTSFFDGNLAEGWKFLVLDEAHTYKGANGTEIALLLRRLKERICGNRKGRIQCIATSATLGNKEALPDLAKFAANIFDEDFQVDDIIMAQRKRREIEPGMLKYSVADYQSFKKQSQTMIDEGVSSEDAGLWLYEKLVQDERIISAFHLLEARPKNLRDVADQVFCDYDEESEKIQGMITLIELGVMAKANKDAAALLPARYHLFVRALEGVYVSLYPEKNVYLDRKEQIASGGRIVPVFELANCKNCSQEYLVGKENQGFLKSTSEDDKLEYYLLTPDPVESDVVTDSDDEAFVEKINVRRVESFKLCTACGKLTAANVKRVTQCCDVQETSKIITVYKMKTTSNSSEINVCAACGGVSKSIIKRFLTANQPATYILANSLYTMIPPQKFKVPQVFAQLTKPECEQGADDDFNLDYDFSDEATQEVKNLEYYDESGRKLLVFSDNRQEAAFFAPYMNNKYHQMMWRRLIIKIVKMQSREYLMVDLIPQLVDEANKAGLYKGLREKDDLTGEEKRQLAAIYLMKEYLGFERQQGLEGSGYIRFIPDLEKFPGNGMGLNNEELTSLCFFLLDTMRYTCATTYPDISPSEEQFAPRNRPVWYRGESASTTHGKTVMGFLPAERANNVRLDYFRKILEVQGLSQEQAKIKGRELLGTIYQRIIQGYFLPQNYIQSEHLGNLGQGILLNNRKWKVGYCADEDTVYCCDRCGKLTHHNIKDVCPTFRCSGKLKTLSAREFRSRDPYYTRLYSSETLRSMICKEHTGQVNSDEASKTQSQFEQGDVNVLSCTTTFEMGVDVGQLEATLLRNVPPRTDNYIQRAGRAGRRTSATALTVTYARRNSHDLHYFQHPTEMISGKIRSPYIELDNDKIAARHVNSIVLAWFFRRNDACKAYFQGNVSALVGDGNDNTIVTALEQELNARPAELLESIERVLSPHLVESMGIRQWSFVDKLVGPDGSLANAVAEKKTDLDTLQERLTEAFHKNSSHVGSLMRLKKTLESQQTIPFLSVNGVIPKYGFPVDVVKLDIMNDSEEAAKVDLSRDLKLAIAEYAPGSEVIAAGKIWTSRIINKIRDKEWPAYHYYDCPACGRATFPEGITAIDIKNEEVRQCVCGHDMKLYQVVIPIFGFSTCANEKPKSVGETRPKRFYPTKVQFGGFDELDHYEQEEQRMADVWIADKRIGAVYSPQGKLVVMNRGTNGGGLFICKFCGYAQSSPTNFSPHENKAGKTCKNTHWTNAALGHIFSSDVLRLEFPERAITSTYDGKELWTSLIYAILEGAADALGIAREDINGCLDRSGNYPVVVLFDETPGGAGHVKRIYSNLETVLKAAYGRVDGHCNCGDETSCYGCLRGYSNQLDHEKMSRGMAKEYLEWLLLEKSGVQFRYMAPSLPADKQDELVMPAIEIPSDWKPTLQLLMSPHYAAIYQFAMDLIAQGVIQPPDEIGYELYSEELGVLGYTAELVWHKSKIALIANNDSKTSEQFASYGWKVFVMNQEKVEEIAKELQ